MQRIDMFIEKMIWKRYDPEWGQIYNVNIVYDKKLIVKELTKNNIQSILSTPQNLTVNTINKYLELKARQKI